MGEENDVFGTRAVLANHFDAKSAVEILGRPLIVTIMQAVFRSGDVSAIVKNIRITTRVKSTGETGGLVVLHLDHPIEFTFTKGKNGIEGSAVCAKIILNETDSQLAFKLTNVTLVSLQSDVHAP